MIYGVARLVLTPVVNLKLTTWELDQGTVSKKKILPYLAAFGPRFMYESLLLLLVVPIPNCH